jgi:hypothetical protein
METLNTQQPTKHQKQSSTVCRGRTFSSVDYALTATVSRTSGDAEGLGACEVSQPAYHPRIQSFGHRPLHETSPNESHQRIRPELET